MNALDGWKSGGENDVGPEAFRARPNRLTTERLESVPLTLDEFALYLADVDAFAEALSLAEPPSEPDAETRAAFNWLFENALALDAASLCWSTLWLPILRSENRVVGGLCFKGPPRPLFDFLETAPNFKIDVANVAPDAVNENAQGDASADKIVDASALTAVVEIGYGVDKAFRGRGLATEAVGALVDWGREREDVGAFLAETLTANLPSRRVLEKCGFQPCGESDDAVFWRVDVSRRATEKDGV